MVVACSVNRKMAAKTTRPFHFVRSMTHRLPALRKQLRNVLRGASKAVVRHCDKVSKPLYQLIYDHNVQLRLNQRCRSPQLQQKK